MSLNVQEFKLAVREYTGKETEKRVQQITQAAALYALRNVVLGTRVDTGRARGNWQVAEGAPPEGFDPERKDPQGAFTIGRGTRTIQRVSGARIVWLHNGVPYIGFLEDKDRMVAGTYEALRTWLRSRR